jgi:DUF971 family protein
MGFRQLIRLTCEFAHEVNNEGEVTQECGDDVEYLGVKIIGKEIFKLMLCEGHAKGRYTYEIWDQDATLFSLSAEGHTP